MCQARHGRSIGTSFICSSVEQNMPSPIIPNIHDATAIGSTTHEYDVRYRDVKYPAAGRGTAAVTVPGQEVPRREGVQGAVTVPGPEVPKLHREQARPAPATSAGK